MKKTGHPTWYKDAVTICVCGNVVHAGSTKPELHTELCSACHPFYTGKQKLVDTAGRVDKFMAKMAKAETLKEEKKTQKKKEVAPKDEEEGEVKNDKEVKETKKIVKKTTTAKKKKA